MFLSKAFFYFFYFSKGLDDQALGIFDLLKNQADIHGRELRLAGTTEIDSVLSNQSQGIGNAANAYGVQNLGPQTMLNAALGKEIINKSGLNVIPADDLDDAAQKIVKAVKGTA